MSTKLRLRSDIENAIIDTARAAGIVHKRWHNTDSAWLDLWTWHFLIVLRTVCVIIILRFGPAQRVVALSKLTVQLARWEDWCNFLGEFAKTANTSTSNRRFTRAHMFGPGTKCRCANCTDFPESCCWSQVVVVKILIIMFKCWMIKIIWRLC